MGRRILGIFAGFVAMLVGAIALLGALYAILGSERYFEPGTYHASALAIVVGFVVAILSALGGGWIAARIGGLTAARILAFIFVIFGYASAIPTITSKSDPGPRAPEVSDMEAMQRSKQPAWVTFLHPMVGAAAVLVGARRKRT